MTIGNQRVVGDVISSALRDRKTLSQEIQRPAEPPWKEERRNRTDGTASQAQQAHRWHSPAEQKKGRLVVSSRSADDRRSFFILGAGRRPSEGEGECEGEGDDDGEGEGEGEGER